MGKAEILAELSTLNPEERQQVFQRLCELQEEIKLVANRDVSSRISYAVNLLEEVVVIDPETRGGVPVLVGTRVPISRLFAEVATGRTIVDIADDKDLEIEAVRQVFKGFAAYLGRSYAP